MSIHVQTNIKGRWGWRRAGSFRMYRLAPNKRAGVRDARRAGKRSGEPVYVHAKDGTVERKFE